MRICVCVSVNVKCGYSLPNTHTVRVECLCAFVCVCVYVCELNEVKYITLPSCNCHHLNAHFQCYHHLLLLLVLQWACKDRVNTQAIRR